MKSFEKKLRALFYKLDGDYAIFYIMDERLAPDTYKFVNTYYVGQNKSITPTQFRAKISAKSRAYPSKASTNPILLEELLGNPVDLTVMVKHYYFTSAGKKIVGWTMHLHEMHLL